MKKRKIKVEKVQGRYTANGVPFDYAYWTEEDRDPCPECGSRVRLVESIMDVDYFCPFCNKYVEPKCTCGECSSESRSNRPIVLPEFRQKIKAIENQDSDHLEWMHGWTNNAWVANLLKRIEIYEQYKYLSPSDQSLIAKQSSGIEQVMQLIGEGKNELASLLYFKAAINIIIAELKNDSSREIYSDFLRQIDILIQNENYLKDADFYGTFEYQEFYEKIVTFYYPDEIEDPDDRYDSMFSAQVEEDEKALNQKLEDGWSAEMKGIRSKISSVLAEGGEAASMLDAYISLYDVDIFIDHLLEKQKKLDSEISHYELMNGNSEDA
ncbi:hypothetical protein HOG48_00680 [Candidatus Peregrinibacteria bacterium]|nr:hypothetical protein [Candidatus Peregrinibacteria bacterium]